MQVSIYTQKNFFSYKTKYKTYGGINTRYKMQKKPQNDNQKNTHTYNSARELQTEGTEEYLCGASTSRAAT